MTPFERSLSKLSENHKIVEIECTELKLWQLKESPNHAALIIECKEWNFRQHEFQNDLAGRLAETNLTQKDNYAL